MGKRMKIEQFQALMDSDEEESKLLSVIRMLTGIEDTDKLSASIKTAPPAFGSWSGWSY
jgi:hypothetical protein